MEGRCGEKWRGWVMVGGAGGIPPSLKLCHLERFPSAHRQVAGEVRRPWVRVLMAECHAIQGGENCSSSLGVIFSTDNYCNENMYKGGQNVGQPCECQDKHLGNCVMMPPATTWRRRCMLAACMTLFVSAGGKGRRVKAPSFLGTAR